MEPKSGAVQYLEIVDWDKFITAEIRNRYKPPYRWCKLHAGDLDILGDLTLRELGAYIRLLQLATQTDNRIVFRPGWIRRRSGVSRTAIDTLLDRNLVRLTLHPAPVGKPQENQSSSTEKTAESDRMLLNSRSLDRKGKGYRIDGSTRGGANLKGNGAAPADPSPISESSDPPSAAGHDPRPWAEIDSIVLAIARRLRTTDAAKIHGSSDRRVSLSQCQHSLKQLIARGELENRDDTVDGLAEKHGLTREPGEDEQHFNRRVVAADTAARYPRISTARINDRAPHDSRTRKGK